MIDIGDVQGEVLTSEVQLVRGVDVRDAGTWNEPFHV